MRTKIDYGIDLGTTNSAIARMENGKPKVIQTDVQKDTLPSCVAVNPRKNLIHGDAAYTSNIKDKLRALETLKNEESNSYLEFKRTMGKEVKYHSSLLKKDFSSEELSAEVLMKLKSFITDETVKSVVITVPAMFTMSQNEATIKAGKMAGFEIIELLQEPIAASIAYGLDAQRKEGIWAVFDFGGGTFDAALIKVEEGIMKVLDTEGNNQLGGKDLDLAIVDKLIIPHLQENFSIEEIINDRDKKEILRNAMKPYAEEIKIQLSFNSETDKTTFPGEIRAKDKEGLELALSLDVSQDDLVDIFEPIFQQAIDITKQLLQKNNLKGSQLECLILVGGPTYSPILQKMLKEQITQNVIAKNQMTSVAIGASLYASTREIGIVAPLPPKGTLSLDLKYSSTTVELDEMVTVKIKNDESNSSIPTKIFIVLDRGDKSFSSNKIELSGKKSTLIDIILSPNESNYFKINLTDGNGDTIQCQPDSFTILQGIKEPLAPLPYHIGIEVWDEKKKVAVFKGLKGLEKNQILKGAVGISPKLKTPKQITAGLISDVLRIPIYQGSDGAENKNSFHSNHVVDVVITGESIPKLIPANSDLEFTLMSDASGSLTYSAYFPIINYTEEGIIERIDAPPVDADWLLKEIVADQKRIKKLLQTIDEPDLNKCIDDLKGLESDLDNEQGSEDGKSKILGNLRKIRLIIEKFEFDKEWPDAEQELKDSFYSAEELIEKVKEGGLEGELNMSYVISQMDEFRLKIDQIIVNKELALAIEMKEEIVRFMHSIVAAVTPDDGDREKGFINYVDNNYSKIRWLNPSNSRLLINQAISNINNEGDLNQLKQLCVQIDNLRDRTDPKQPKDIPKF